METPQAMKRVLVAVKRVIDPYVKVRVKPDNSAIETQNVKMTMNPFDEIALEEAIRLKEAQIVEEVVVVSVGGDSSQETLRHALALGADRGILVKTDRSVCSLNIATVLQKIVHIENPELVLMGKQSIDGDNNQTPQMLAALLDWPQGTFISQLQVEGSVIHVTREIDGGLEYLALDLPAVISADLRLNTPRYASLPNIMKAKQKPLELIELESLGLNLAEHVQILKVAPPSTRKKGIKVSSIDELLIKLQQEAKVL